MARLESKLQSMDLRTFVQFYKSVDSLPENVSVLRKSNTELIKLCILYIKQFLKTFLHKVKVPPGSRLTDEPWKFLMDKVAKRY